ncbi:MAG: hypothetical protein OES57_09650, partial [Acidimicrobiia bacterium]|nr:hypothetical protein [Acidimicrobiia bacterium]
MSDARWPPPPPPPNGPGTAPGSLPPPPPPAPYGPAQQVYPPPPYGRGPEYASWGQRLGAFLLDGLIVGVPFWVLSFAAGLLV